MEKRTRERRVGVVLHSSIAARAIMKGSNRRWEVSTDEQYHEARVALIREVFYEMTNVVCDDHVVEHRNGHQGFAKPAKGLSLNISSGGMLLLMDSPPEVERVLRVHVPTPVSNARTPTLAEVRWVRQVPFVGVNDLSLVGVRFLF